MAENGHTDVEFQGRPKLAVTLGDVCGVGPELAVRACLDGPVRDLCEPVLYGHPEIVRRAAVLIGEPSPLSTESPFPPVSVVNPSEDEILDCPPGEVDGRAGRAAYEFLTAAIAAARSGEVDGIVTAPLSKAALHRAGLDYPGHTEILAEQCGVRDFAMMLYLPPDAAAVPADGLGVAHVTLHTSIASVPELLTMGAVRSKIELIHHFLKQVGIQRPRIGVAALNPHAGEEGLFGDEEARIIAPAVEHAVAEGHLISGPLPADTLLLRAVRGEFDGVVAMYHDQGHIALKLLGFDRAVNVTLGLPIVRTSPSQGTAFDIAWTGRANPQGMIAAIRIAAQLAKNLATVQET